MLARVSPAKAPGRKGRRKDSRLNSSLPSRLRSHAFAGEKSPILDALGPASFAEFKAVRHPGTILWCNFELLHQLGFDVPASNQLTPELTEQLLATLCLRSLPANEVTNTNEVVTLYADKYGGEGVNPALGAGRAGFLAQGNLYVKGLGFTPLFRHNDADDFVHSHGGVHLEDCLSEAIFGEVNHNLFTLGSNRIVAIIDQGMHVTAPSGQRRHIALAIRAGSQLRPGHLLARRTRGSQSPVEMFISMTRATNQLVISNDLPNVSATMLRVIDDHAQTAADSFRWRMIHGALSPSNMDISGAMLDLPTQSTQPRTAPIFMLDYVQSAFGTEHKERGFHLAETYRRILRSADPATRERLQMQWINVSNLMDQAYEKYLQVKLLAATGLKTELSRQIQAEHSDLSARFTKLLLEMAALKNAGSACVARSVVEDLSVVDVFNLLSHAPHSYFADQNLTKESVLKHLKAVYKGNRFQVAKREEAVALLATEFAKLYAELMNVCSSHAGEYYDSHEAMIASITARAAFENQPIDALYTFSLYERLNSAIDEYKTTDNATLIADVIDTSVARSLRSVDRLLTQGTSRALEDGGLEIERRTIRGLTYSIRAWDDRAQTRKLHVSVPADSRTLEFDFRVSTLVGRIESRRFGGYVFALPDREELRRRLSA